MTRTRSVRCPVAALATAATLAGTLLAAATPASASEGQITISEDGHAQSAPDGHSGPVIDRIAQVQVSAKLRCSPLSSVRLSVFAPGEESSHGKPFAQTSASPAQSCRGHSTIDVPSFGTSDPDVRNGTWTVTLRDLHRPYLNNDRQTFIVAAPPQQVGKPTVNKAGTGNSMLTWWADAEPDIQRYELAGKHPKGATLRGARCGDSTCTASVSTPGRYDAAVRAVRACPAGCGADKIIAGRPSDPVAFAVAAASPSASPSDSHAPARPRTAGEHASAPVHHRGFRGGDPGFTALASPKAASPAPRPGKPSRTAPAPGTTEGPDGPFATTLGYGDRTIVTTTPAHHRRQLADEPLGVDNRTLWTLIAGALLLMLVGAHLRSWLRRSDSS